MIRLQLRLRARHRGSKPGCNSAPACRAVGAAVTVAVMLGACGVPLNDTPTDAGGTSGTSSTINRIKTDGSLPVRIFFLRDGRFDWVERRDTASSTTHPEIAIRNTIESLKAGLLPRERTSGFTSPLEDIVADTDLSLAVAVVDGVVEINLSSIAGVLRGLPETQLRSVIAQLALTSLLATPGIGGVRFVLDDQFVRLISQSGSIGPEYHVGDFPCLVEDRSCELPGVLLPEVRVEDVTADSTISEDTEVETGGPITVAAVSPRI